MKTFHELQEGLQDPNIFKCFFLAGGPGSGKSYVVRYSIGGTGLRRRQVAGFCWIQNKNGQKTT